MEGAAKGWTQLGPIADALYDCTLGSTPVSTIANEAALSKLKNARSCSVGNQSERVDRVKAAHGNFPTAVMQPSTETFRQAACKRTEAASRHVGQSGEWHVHP